jgi:hypothetical protein
MSAYVVEDLLIDVIVSGLKSLSRPGAYIERPAVFNELNLDSTAGAKKAGQFLKALNIRAVCERYTSDEASDYADYEYSSVLRPSLSALYRALRTYMYQCSEGSVPKTKLYKQMESLKNDVACAIADAQLERSGQ